MATPELETVGAPLTRAPGWPGTLVALLAALAGAGLLYAGTARGLAELWWNSDSYGHGLLVVPITAFLLWRERRRLGAIVPEPGYAGALLALGAALLWWAGRAASVLIAEQVALYAMLPAAVIALAGWRVARAAAFALAYPLLAIPVWDVLIAPLQDVTAGVSVWALRVLGVPVFVEGNFFTIPYGRFEIAEVCAGLRYFLAALSIVTLFAHLELRAWWRRLAFVALGIATAVVFNWVRVVVIMYIGYASRMQNPLVQDHQTFGWLLFAGALVPLFWVGYRLADVARAPLPGEPAAPAGEPARGRLAVALLVLLAAAGSGQALARWTLAGEAPAPLLAAPRDLPGWRGPLAESPPGGWRPRYRGAAAERLDTYRADAWPVYLYLAAYGRERQGAELINELNGPFDPDALDDVGRARLTVELGGRRLAVDEVRLRARSSGAELLVWQWYRVAGVNTTSRPLAKLLQLRGLLERRPYSAAVVLATPASDSGEAARETLRAFLAAAGTKIENALTVPPAGGR